MRYSGLSPDGRLVEIAEYEDHPFMVGTQFHPEFLSRPNRPHPLFVAFLESVCYQAGIRSGAGAKETDFEFSLFGRLILCELSSINNLEVTQLKGKKPKIGVMGGSPHPSPLFSVIPLGTA